MKLKSGIAELNHNFISKMLPYHFVDRSAYPLHQQRLKSLLLAGGFCLGLILSTATSAQAGDFQAVEQPLALRLGVTALGLGLIVLELWWFLARRK